MFLQAAVSPQLLQLCFQLLIFVHFLQAQDVRLQVRQLS
jgi:hypothetical protein